MLEIAICDDENYLSGYLEETLYAIGKDCNLKLDVEVYRDGEEIVTEVQEGKRFDIIFMDIMMDKMNGLEAADHIRELDRVTQLIYVTSYEGYMGDAFRTAPIGFLVKPVEPEKLQEVFLRAVKIIGDEDEYYRFQYRKAEYKVSVRRILYCESHKRQTEIAGEGVNCMVNRRLTQVEADLAKYKGCFIRIHESFLVNYRHVLQFSYETATLSNGKELPISRSRSREAMRILMELNMRGEDGIH